MTKRTVSVTRDGLSHVFAYELGDEERLVEEIILQADEDDAALSWFDAAQLSLQVAQATANDCRKAAALPPAGRSPGRGDDGDAKDGPCQTNCS